MSSTSGQLAGRTGYSLRWSNGGLKQLGKGSKVISLFSEGNWDEIWLRGPAVEQSTVSQIGRGRSLAKIKQSGLASYHLYFPWLFAFSQYWLSISIDGLRALDSGINGSIVAIWFSCTLISVVNWGAKYR